MIDRIKELAVNGQWQEVIEQGSALLSSDHGLDRDDVAWLHIAIGSGWVETAASAADLRLALSHVFAGYRCATPGGRWHTSALQKLSSILVDIGHYSSAKGFARSFLKAAAPHPDLVKRTGWALRDLGIIAMRTGRYSEAVKWCSQSAAAFNAAGNEAQAKRGQFLLVWAYCMAGQPALARLTMPTAAPDDMMHLFHSALAVLSAAEGDWAQALRNADQSLSYGRPGYDNVDAADLCALASRAARRHGASAEAATYARRAKAFAALQATCVQAVLILNAERKGGELVDATATLRGSSDLRDGGCFTTGVA